MIKKSTNKTGIILFIGGIIFTLVVVLWPVFMVISQPEGSIDEQIVFIGTKSGVYALNFILASLIAPLLSVILICIAFFVPSNKNRSIINVIGVTFLFPYFVFVSIAYVSQFTIFLDFISTGNFIAAKNWYFNNQDSVSYFLNQIGYTFFALGGLLIGFRFLFEKGLPRIVGILLWLSSILSIVAFIGLIIKSDILNFSTIVSGVLTIPIGLLVILWGKRISKNAI